MFYGNTLLEAHRSDVGFKLRCCNSVQVVQTEIEGSLEAAPVFTSEEHKDSFSC